jgi:hypothetical protein
MQYKQVKTTFKYPIKGIDKKTQLAYYIILNNNHKIWIPKSWVNNFVFNKKTEMINIMINGQFENNFKLKV